MRIPPDSTQEEDEDKTFFRDLNCRLTGRPVHTSLWLFGLLLTLESIPARDIVRRQVSVQTTWPVFLAGIFQFGVFGFYLIAVLWTEKGRRWLIEKQAPAQGKSISCLSKWVVRLFPLFWIFVVYRVWTN